MLNTIIIEDERPAMELLVQSLNDIDADIQINALLNTVKDSIDYLSQNPKADLIFSDVQLSDGLSFEIFRQPHLATVPVVFITGYDTFMTNAFDCNGIDYLLKPVSKNELQRAVRKYQLLEKHFATQQSPLEKFMRQLDTKKKSRLVVKKGVEFIALKLDDIALLYTEHKLVFVIDNAGKKYIADKTLGELEQELDDSHFFRANRQYIININFIKGFKPFEKVKLQIELSIPELSHEIIVSQENAPHFRQWIYEA